MSLSLNVSQTNANQQPATPSLSSPTSQPSASGSQQRSQRATAASRRAAAAATQSQENLNAPKPSAGQPAASPSASDVLNIPPTPSAPEPSATASQTQKRASQRVGRTSAAAAIAAIPSSSPAPAAASASAVASSTAAVKHRIHIGVDDGSSSFLSKFTFAPTDGEPGGQFQVWVHHSPQDDTLQCILMQSTQYRIYTFTGKLTELRPTGLYMSGMKDLDYRNYVLNGLKEQDQKENYEYEFVTAHDPDSDEPEDPDVARAQLRLYKQMGDSTRVPVCIAHLRFEPMKLSATASSTGLRRQDELQYQTSFSLLADGLTSYIGLLRTRRAQKEQELDETAQEMKVVEELSTLPPVLDLTKSSKSLLARLVDLLNGKKSLIREGRSRNDELKRQCDALRPKRPGVKKEEEYSSSDEEFDEVSLSGDEAQEERRDANGDVQMNDADGNGSARASASVAPRNQRPSDDGPAAMEVDEPVRHASAAAASSSSANNRRQSPPAAAADGVPASSLPSPAAAAASNSASLPRHSLSFGFPDSIEPAFSPSFGLSSVSMPPPSQPQQVGVGSPPGSGSRGTRGSRDRPSQQLPSNPPTPGDLDLSPPKAKAIVRKRARPIPTQPSPSQGTPLSYGASQGGYVPSHRPSTAQTAVVPMGAGGGGSHGSRPRDASQMIRELASNASRRIPGAGAVESPDAEQQPATNSKKQRTQGSIRTSKLLGEID